MTPRRFRLFWGLFLAAFLLLCPYLSLADEPASERLLLFANVEERTTSVEVEVKKPFDVYLVAERDAEIAQVSTVVFTLGLPEGLLLVGEELEVEALIALGTSKAGINLAFHCLDGAQVKILHFRLVATRKLEKARIRLLPDARTDFLGIVACKAEKFEKWETEEASLTVTAR